MTDSHHVSDPPWSLPAPPTPVMLYIGAGYDLSPILTFAPGGPPYPIVPLSRPNHAHASPYGLETYTSFLFVDAKPRYTSAYMVSDFDEWTSIEARVRNVLHYAQGALSRWRTIPGAPDLIWFEGGGNAALIDSRGREPAWVFPDLPDHSVMPESRATSSRTQPLTTLLYLFNTLDVELVHAPLLERVWPRVEALYVHGLRLHVRTGAGMSTGGDGAPGVYPRTSIDADNSSASMHNRTQAGPSLQSQLGTGLKRCYVIVGSWGTPLRQSPGTEMGMRHVDFVRDAWKRWKMDTRDHVTGQERRVEQCVLMPDPSLPSLTIKCPSSTPSHPAPPSPLVFRPPRVRYSKSTHQTWHSDGGWDSDYDGDSEGVYSDWDESEFEYPHEQANMEGSGITRSTMCSPTCSPHPFYTRIPQLAWSPMLRGGQGGYYVAKTIEESVAVWRARRGGSVVQSEGDESASGEEPGHGEYAKRTNRPESKAGMHRLYGLRSFLNMRPPTSMIHRTHTSPARPLPKLRPRPATPALNSEDTDTEHSASEMVFVLGHCDAECQCECGREGNGAACRVRAEREIQRVFGFWPRGMHARHERRDQVAHVEAGRDRPGMTKARARSMPHVGREIKRVPEPLSKDTSQVTPWHPRNPACKALHAHSPAYVFPPPIAPSSRERRIDITAFLSTPSDPDACDMVEHVTSNAATLRTVFPALSDASPSSFTICHTPTSSTLSSTPATSTVWSSSSPSPVPSPASAPAMFPPSPYGPSNLYDKDQQEVASGRKRRPLLLALGIGTKQQHEEYSASPGLTRARSISGLFQRGWKTSQTTTPHDDMGQRSSPDRPPSPKRSPSPLALSSEPPASSTRLRPTPHTRPGTAPRHRFQFDPDAPPVPVLPSHGHGHAHAHSSYEPRQWDQETSYARSRTQRSSLHSRAGRSEFSGFSSNRRDGLDRLIGTPARESHDSDIRE